MSHPEIDNRTPFAAEALPHNDENFRPVYTVLLKATYDIVDTGQLRLAEEQPPLLLAGEYYGDPETTSLKYEPECTLTKQATDVVLIGHAYPESPQHRQTKVGIRIGPIQKTAMVFGDRVWENGINPTASFPQPFEKIPLIWENAFGGQDLRVENPDRPSFEARNPIGKGYADKKQPFPEGLPLPNIENPDHLIQHWQDRPPPCGFGFVSPHWSPRSEYAGTYDEHWDTKRKPLLPKDFNRAFFNAADSGLQVPGYLQGDEEVIIVNASERGRLAFQLPGLPAPVFQMKFHFRDDVVAGTNLDTVIVNTDDHQLIMFWRALVPTPRGHLDLAELNIKIPGAQVLQPKKKAS
ncbi:hypothetical protein BTA51_22850 [Hahella sp. CCB-MM4]|uniref:DUF2169 family type VI secretion system accessory protein n=1 Tax=Hahella sp. (strain CCB-MM4) TaxID=1926491 RepID=UPI000B9BD7E8|nr:DUF2169 domain-containing protein [Hahella sp. CCB-MM4]OZG70948.1 hypothetical protein BTA51_22850 [Hahella sp. CCB-MM4]